MRKKKPSGPSPPPPAPSTAVQGSHVPPVVLAPLPYNDDGANADNVAQPRLGALRFATDAYMERFDSAP